MTDRIKNFIIKHKGLIEENKFRELYTVLNNTIYYYYPLRGELTQILIDSGIDFLDDMDYIPEACFYGVDLTKIEIPDHIKVIEESAFKNCKKLNKVIISNRVSDILEYAFEGCSSLKDIYIPSNVTYIASSAFSYSPSLVITTTKNSTAHEYTKTYGIKVNLI